MSRAFVREQDDAPVAGPPPRTDSRPNYVTHRGLVQLRERLGQAQQRLKMLGLTELERAWAQREHDWVQSRVASAIPVERAPRDEAGFGAIVEVASEGETRTWHIVGDDEADTRRGLVAWSSPLARALIGARVGDTVTWKKPSGESQLLVLNIEYPH